MNDFYNEFELKCNIEPTGMSKDSFDLEKHKNPGTLERVRRSEVNYNFFVSVHSYIQMENSLIHIIALRMKYMKNKYCE